jgi:hypothetical protein
MLANEAADQGARFLDVTEEQVPSIFEFDELSLGRR